MKILHINSYYIGSNFYKNLYDKQKDNGLDIDVYVPVSKTINTSTCQFGDYAVISANHGKYDRLFFHIKHNKIYRDIVNKYEINKYSIIHAHSLFSNGYIAMKLKERFGIPYIVAIRNTDINVFFKYMIYLRKLGIKILQEADRIVFLSETYKDYVIKNYIPARMKEEISNKTSIIPNGIDDFWLNNKGVAKKLLNTNNLKLLYVGVINKNKNVITTIEAIEVLRKEGYDIKFTIVGKIKDKLIYRKIKELNFINYIAPKFKEDLIKIYRNNDVFVMPSIHETFGLVYAEAMSQGLPIIYTKGQGFDGQFIEGEVGYSVNPRDKNDIVRKVAMILEDYERLSIDSIIKCDKFNWNFINESYTKIYRSLLANYN